MSLYLKYRPQGFGSLVGQEHITTTIQNALKHEALTHAYLFAGPRGTGKTSLARIIAKAINCPELSGEGEPCNTCHICTEITSGRLVDLIEIDAASNRGIDEIRELREKILFSPTHAKAKVYIIDEVHMLTKEAFNALLKTLEEPPSHAYFILATTEIHKIPETIISRCQRFSFKRITIDHIVGQLEKIAKEEEIEANPEALKLIAKMANGGLRDAIGLFEQMNLDGKIEYDQVAKNLGLSGAMLIESFFEALIAKDAQKALEIINQVNVQGKNLHQFTGEVISFLREQMLINIGNAEQLTSIVELIDIFGSAKPQINQSFIPQLPLEIAIVKACELTDKEPVVTKEKKAVETSASGGTASEVKKSKPEVKVAEKAPEKGVKEEGKSNGTPSELNLNEIKNNWQHVASKIETPFIRLSLLDGEPTKYEKGELHLAFKSSTLMDKIANTTHQAHVQKALESVFSTKLKLHLELKQVNLKPITESAPKEEKTSVVDMAKEVFGG